MKDIYFETGDSRRTYTASGQSFNFTKWGMIGGSPQGVYKAQSEGEAAALSVLASDAKSGVWAISVADYERKLGVKQSEAPMAWQTYDSTTSKTGNQPPVPLPGEFVKPKVDRSEFPQPTPAAEPVIEVKPLAESDEFRTGKTEVVVHPLTPGPSAKSSKKPKSE